MIVPYQLRLHKDDKPYVFIDLLCDTEVEARTKTSFLCQFFDESSDGFLFEITLVGPTGEIAL